MMFDIIVFFLIISIVLYAILGGADFGAGILQMVSPKKQERKIETAVYTAMSPVWEANHMWLILAVVILFNGFPKAYAELSILLHMPLTFLLIAIIIRGCTFTFRHYDVKKDNTHIWYTAGFKISSLVSILLLGMLAGAIFKGGFLHADGTSSFYEVYWKPWMSPFCISIGVFCCFIFTFQAAAFLSGEVGDEDLRQYLLKVCRISSLGMIVVGPLVFGTAYLEDIPLAKKFFSNPPSIICFVVSTILVLIIRKGLIKDCLWMSRVALGAQTGLVILGAGFIQFPDVVRYQDGTVLTLQDCAAPESTQVYLLGALVFGIIVIAPLLAYLFKVFQYHSAEEGQ